MNIQQKLVEEFERVLILRERLRLDIRTNRRALGEHSIKRVAALDYMHTLNTALMDAKESLGSSIMASSAATTKALAGLEAVKS